MHKWQDLIAVYVAYGSNISPRRGALLYRGPMDTAMISSAYRIAREQHKNSVGTLIVFDAGLTFANLFSDEVEMWANEIHNEGSTYPLPVIEEWSND